MRIFQDVQSTYVENTMSQTTTLSTPQAEVDGLIAQVADEHNLNLTDQLGGARVAKEKPAEEKDADDLAERLAALKSL